MELMRLGEPGQEIPVATEDGKYFDLRSVTADIDGGFLGGGGIDRVRSALKAAQATVLIHLAPQASNHVPHIDSDWKATERSLREGTPALVRAAEAAGIQYLVLVGYAFAGEQVAAHGHDDDQAGLVGG